MVCSPVHEHSSNTPAAQIHGGKRKKGAPSGFKNANFDKSSQLLIFVLNFYLIYLSYLV